MTPVDLARELTPDLFSPDFQAENGRRKRNLA